MALDNIDGPINRPWINIMFFVKNLRCKYRKHNVMKQHRNEK
jgi:hypothetical protein